MKRFSHSAPALAAALAFLFAQQAFAQQSGTLKGKVAYGGAETPQREQINVNGNVNAAQCLANGPVLSDKLVVNPKNKGVRWAFVWLQPSPGGSKLPVRASPPAAKLKPAEIDQPCCMFIPHAVAIQEGQTLVVKNSAPFSHNTNWFSINNPGDNQLIASGGKIVIANLKADRYPVKLACNIHGWMNAFVGVFDHPYFAVTDEDGNFEIKDAPAGEHRIVVWQESVGYVTKNIKEGERLRDGQPITVKPGGVTDAGEFKVVPK